MNFDDLKKGYLQRREVWREERRIREEENRIRESEAHIALNITAGNKKLNLGRSTRIVMRQNADGHIYFDTLPGEFFLLDGYTWDGPHYKTVTTSTETGKARDAYEVTGKKSKKGEIQTDVQVTVAENQVEIPSNGSIRLKNVATGETFSIGFECDSKTNVELDAFDWSSAEKTESERTAAVQSQSDKVRLLKEYKELLDAGIITQAEFDQKKSELL